MVRARSARARADEARPPAASLPGQVHPAARRDTAGAVRAGGRPRPRSVRGLGDHARPVAGEWTGGDGHRRRGLQLPADAGEDRALQRVRARARDQGRAGPLRGCRRHVPGTDAGTGLRRPLVRSENSGGAAGVPGHRHRLLACGRPEGRARAGGSLRAPDGALRPRLSEGAAGRAVLVPQAQARVPAGRSRRPLPPPLRPRHARQAEGLRPCPLAWGGVGGDPR